MRRVEPKKKGGGPKQSTPSPFPGIILNKKLLLLGQICVQLPRTTPISVKEPHVLRGGEGWIKHGAGARKFTKIKRRGGGQDTFPLPTSQNIPKQTVCPLFCYQGKFVYIHTLKYILCKLADKMEAKTLLNHMYWGGQMVPRHFFP